MLAGAGMAPSLESAEAQERRGGKCNPESPQEEEEHVEALPKKTWLAEHQAAAVPPQRKLSDVESGRPLQRARHDLSAEGGNAVGGEPPLDALMEDLEQEEEMEEARKEGGLPS
eukprot:3781487-Rhodomonas_salina.1